MERFMTFNQGKDDTIEPAYMKNFSGSNNGQSELPAVTTEDNGKVLTVVDGAWTKADTPGGGEPFVIGISTHGGQYFSADKTATEIDTAYKNKAAISFKIDSSAYSSTFQCDVQTWGYSFKCYSMTMSGMGNTLMMSVSSYDLRVDTTNNIVKVSYNGVVHYPAN